MKIVVVGDGKVGATLVSQLVKEGHDVTVIDNNAAVLRRSTDTMDGYPWQWSQLCHPAGGGGAGCRSFNCRHQRR